MVPLIHPQARIHHAKVKIVVLVSESIVWMMSAGLAGRPVGEQISLERGDAFTFPADMEHTFAVPPRAGRTQVLWLVSPALPDHGLEAPPSAY